MATRRRFLKVITAAVASGCASETSPTAGQGGGSGADAPPDGFELHGALADLPEGALQRFQAQPIAVSRDSGGVFAMSTLCTHAGCDLLEGSIGSSKITCMCHGSEFDKNGANIKGPANNDLLHNETWLAPSGKIYVNINSFVDADFRSPLS